MLDALMCRPSPEQVCTRNCRKLRGQWCQNVGVCRIGLCQLWHEADAHVSGCATKKMCEYANQIQLRETLHQIEHQHQRINDVRGELEERRQELTEANASRLSNPPSKIALLNKHVELLERELRSEEEQLEFYYRKKREHTDAAKEVEIDTVAELIDLQAHYVAKRSTVAHSTADQASIIKEDRASQVVSTTKSHAKKDELLPSVDDVIGKFCYAGQRSQEQTKMLKECLRKSIEFIDDLLCKPPRGKVCVRGCKKIRDNRCAKDVPCDFEICRNWHSAEAHTDNCLNPQCEFKLRIVLREVMHAVEEKQRVVQDERANVRQKRLALEIIKRDEANTENTHGSDSLVDTRKRDQFLEAKLLKDEIDQLADDLTKEERLLHELNVKKKEVEEKLYTIGIDNSDDVIDGFPDFTTHYENKRGSKKPRSRL